MTTRLRITIAALAPIAFASALAGCNVRNANFCPGRNPLDNCSEPALNDAQGVDAAITNCTGDSTCTETGAMVCDLTLTPTTCVECHGSADTACGSTTPTCGSDDRCHACTAHSDCASGACLPTGACGSDGDTLFVSPGVSGGDCTFESPCGTLNAALTHGGAQTNIKINGGGTVSDAGTAGINSDFTIIADPGATVTTSGVNASIIAVSGSASVAIYDLRLAGTAGGSAGIDIGSGSATVTLSHVIIDDNGGVGVKGAAGNLTLTRSIIANNLGGGIMLAGADFTIINNIITENGSPNGAAPTTFGGAFLSPATSNYTFEFNTVADNNSTTATGGNRGLDCAVSMTVANNIVVDNLMGGNCSASYSLFDITTTGTGNKSTMPPIDGNADFLDTTTVTGTSYYRIGSASPAVDSAQTTSSVTVDIDGIARPQGSGYDIGASEYKAP